MRVLLIDDTPEIAELLSFALRDHGHDVVAVGFDPAVCELVAAQRPDAVVIDCTSLDMAEMLFDALRSTPEYSQLPIVVVSDTPEKADASLRRREAAHVLLIPKPFTAGHIARALSQLLDQPAIGSQPAPSPTGNVVD
ncbi:MAG TPA: response regulator [Vicinamibacterales bacterium]|nr:response regulator [Vicinamibacterales bacterium]